MRCRVVLVLTLFLAQFCSGQDINQDGVLDCTDTELLGEAILMESNDPRFDLDGNGIVEIADHRVWWEAARTDSEEDVTFDNVVDHRDRLVYALNFIREHPYGACRGDRNFDGQSTRVENDLNDPGFNATEVFPSSPVTNLPSVGNIEAWRSGNGIVIAESAEFELLAQPQVVPAGFYSTRISVRTKNPDYVVAIFHNLEFSGDLHQTKLAGPFGSATPTIDSLESSFFPSENATIDSVVSMRDIDSHVLIRSTDVMYGGGAAYSGIEETNDSTNPTGTDVANLVFPSGSMFTYEYGIGDIRMPYPIIDMFSLRNPFISNDQTMANHVDVAQLVTYRKHDNNESGEVLLKLGVGGGTEDYLAIDDHPVFGLVDEISVPFFNLPCDFDQDAICEFEELLVLEAALGTENSEFNLDTSNAAITLDDVEQWLSWYLASTGTSELPRGDTNLDGRFDSSDLNAIGLYWQSNDASWSGGDFNFDGKTDARDLNQLALRWQTTVAVPEPNSLIAWYVMFAVGLRRAFRRPLCAAKYR